MSHSPDQRRFVARVTGRVQGVGYRFFVRSLAHQLGVKGWVRNERDGSVRVVAEGPEETLHRLLSALRAGPSSADVRQVDVQWESPTGAFHGFDVRF